VVIVEFIPLKDDVVGRDVVVNFVLQLEDSVLELLPLLEVTGFMAVGHYDEPLTDATEHSVVNVGVGGKCIFS
jgi:hypothetical protein